MSKDVQVIDNKSPSPSPANSIKNGRVLAVDLEDERLHALGYEQHMKRGFTLWSMIAFCLTGLGLLPSLGGKYSSLLLCYALQG